MKVLAVLIASATAAMAASLSAAPLQRRGDCTPPQYACKSDNSGWLVCNIDGTWLDGGNCPAGTSCEFIYLSPYCT